MGGGNAAVDAANFLTKYASELYLIHRSALRADKISQDKLYANPKVKVLLETEIRALHGEGKLTSITIYDKAKGEERELPVDAIFVNIGVVPNTELFRGQIRLTESGRIPAGEDCRTEIPGVFAAGDVARRKSASSRRLRLMARRLPCWLSATFASLRIEPFPVLPCKIFDFR